MRLAAYLICIALLVCIPGGASCAWDLFYDGSRLPTDPSLGASQWTSSGGNDLSMCSTDGNVLHLNDTRNDAQAYFARFAIPRLRPLTMEARLRIAGGQANMEVGSPSFTTLLSLSTNRIDVSFEQLSSQTYYADMTAFRTIRVATDAQGESYVWLDGTLVAHGITNIGNQGNIAFGTASMTGRSESLWDYVAYSDAFIPVPEPSSLLALGMGGLGVLGMALRRRRSR